MTKNFAVFDSIKDSDQLCGILSKLEPKVFQQGEFIMRFGQKADFLCIIFEGSVSVQIKGLQIMERKAPDMIGEAALQTRENRSADIKANTSVKTLILYRQSYESALKDYKSDMLYQNEQVVRRSEFTKDWNLIKQVGLSQTGIQLIVPSGKLIYQIGDPSQCVYFLMNGQVQLELHYIVKNIVNLPMSQELYDKKTKSTLVRRVVRKLVPTDMFGFEEIINLQMSRLFTARVVGKEPAKLLIIQRQKFIDFHAKADLLKLHQGAILYTNFIELGKQQLKDMDETHLKADQFVTGANIVVRVPENKRS